MAEGRRKSARVCQGMLVGTKQLELEPGPGLLHCVLCCCAAIAKLGVICDHLCIDRPC